MIDTNQIHQAGEVARAVKEQLSPWIPAITVAAAWLGRELANFNRWAIGAGEKIIAHGGLVRIGIQLFWNKSASPPASREIQPKGQQ